jgi:hypothetical protein
MNASVTEKPVSTLSAAFAEKVSVRTGEMKMRIKKNFLPCFLLVSAVLFFVLPAPAFAQFNKVNDFELSRTNASLTGQPGTIVCPDPTDEESPCYAIPGTGEPDEYLVMLASVHDDYGYDWYKNLKTVGDLYYESSAVLSPLTVESGRDGGYGPDAMYVRLGLGSQEAELASWDTNVTVDCCSDGDCPYCQDQLLGSLHLDGLKVKVNGTSYVTMYMVKGHTGVGVQLDATVDRIDLATFSWGDPDGFTTVGSFGAGFTNAGYVGLKDTSITGVTASGSLSIDVAKNDIGGMSVHVGIDNLNVGMSSLDTTLVLGDKKDFSGTKYVLGTLYMKDLKMNAGGYMDIYSITEESAGLRFGLKVPLLTLNTLSWGDPDGFTTVGSFGAGFTNAGYVGLRNLVIKNLAIAGRVTVEEVCPQTGGTDINLLPVVTGAVSIEFNNLNVSMAYLSTDVALGNRKDNLNQVLGSVSLSNLSMDITTGKIKISAH